ncbi:MAG: DUF1801 domain-containing protein [bacterium]|nr:DUF1801 domain-containing protein [bacterium]
MQSKATTVKEYLAELPEDRRAAISAVRKVILKNLSKGYEEGMGWGMICYSVPLKFYPRGYGENKEVPLPYVALASQKNYMAVYLMNIYSKGGGESWFAKEYKATGKKLDMGKGCVRFKKIDDLPLELIGKAVALNSVKEWIGIYAKSREKIKK